MDTQNFGTGLRYVDAEELERSNAGLMVGAEIRDRENEKVGELDGFVVDAVTGRPKYAVIESGGWFKSERFLLPIGHLDVAPDGNCTIDIERSAIEQYPEFDETSWLRASSEERWAFEYETLSACCPEDAALVGAGEKAVNFDRWAHHHEPAWWRTRAKADPTSALESNRAVPGDPSPHLGGRAQPGDVIGIETAGERSYIADTAESENTRREAAEREAAELDAEAAEARNKEKVRARK
jgi:PRC-barrel domain